ncbi:MAG TPA: SMC-Scp complex subunit ScpB [Pseudonocardiaceae bacterium]|nr:SMC-Scp complex subunit ScpB [Pseudonocardiaceae bacterium]
MTDKGVADDSAAPDLDELSAEPDTVDDGVAGDDTVPEEVAEDAAVDEPAAAEPVDEPVDVADSAQAQVAAEAKAEAGEADAESESGEAGELDVDLDLPGLADDEALIPALEALLLVVDAPASEDSLAGALEVPAARVGTVLARMSADYTEQGRGIDLRKMGDGWRFFTRDRYAPFVEKLLLDGQRARLTRAALETLAVIAYRQPVTRARIAAVRGVNVDGVIRTLVLRGLIEEIGTDAETGGLLYRTTELFLERLGLSSLEELPPIAPLLPEVDAIEDV